MWLHGDIAVEAIVSTPPVCTSTCITNERREERTEKRRTAANSRKQQRQTQTERVLGCRFPLPRRLPRLCYQSQPRCRGPPERARFRPPCSRCRSPTLPNRTPAARRFQVLMLLRLSSCEENTQHNGQTQQPHKHNTEQTQRTKSKRKQQGAYMRLLTEPEVSIVVLLRISRSPPRPTLRPPPPPIPTLTPRPTPSCA